MGAATRASLEEMSQLSVGKAAVAADVDGLFQAGRAIASQAALLAALAGLGTHPGDRVTLLRSALGGSGAHALEHLSAVVERSWSKPSDLLGGIEELGIRTLANDHSANLTGELLAMSRAIRQHSELQLALSNKRARWEGKISLVEKLFADKVSRQTMIIASHIVALPRGRRLTDALVAAARKVADQRGEGLAEVRVADGLSGDQAKALSQMLQVRFGRPHYLDVVHDPSVIGGVRIRVGDVVIDASVQTQLADMRRRLAS